LIYNIFKFEFVGSDFAQKNRDKWPIRFPTLSHLAEENMIVSDAYLITRGLPSSCEASEVLAMKNL